MANLQTSSHDPHLEYSLRSVKGPHRIVLPNPAALWKEMQVIEVSFLRENQCPVFGSLLCGVP